MAYTVTDLDILKACEYALLENGDANADGTAFLTSTWTPAKLTAWMNDRQNRFLKETAAIITRTTQGATALQNRYSAPTSSVILTRLSWTNADSDTVALTQADAWQLDNGNHQWQTDAGTPIAWGQSINPTLTYDIAPAPADVGTIGILYVALGTTLTGAGVVLSVPDEWAPFVKWGVLADALAADGQGCDPERAAYCEQRFSEGVELARVMMRGVGGRF